MSDPGAVERNAQFNEVALQRASQRNGGQHTPPSPPQSVTAATSPSRAVSSPVPFVGTNDQSVGLDDLEHEGLSAAESVPGVGGLVSAAESGFETGKEIGNVESDDGGTLSWGRSGQVEGAPGGFGDAPPSRATGEMAGIQPHNIGAAPMPQSLGAPMQPDTNQNRSWNSADIFANTKIGGR